jgi:hypothetical protein
MGEWLDENQFIRPSIQFLGAAKKAAFARKNSSSVCGAWPVTS